MAILPHGSYSLFQFEGSDVISVLKNSIEYSFMFFKCLSKSMVDRQLFYRNLEYFPINALATFEVKLVLRDKIYLACNYSCNGVARQVGGRLHCVTCHVHNLSRNPLGACNNCTEYTCVTRCSIYVLQLASQLRKKKSIASCKSYVTRYNHELQLAVASI